MLVLYNLTKDIIY